MEVVEVEVATVVQTEVLLVGISSITSENWGSTARLQGVLPDLIA